MIISKQALPRRTFLRGVGATLALPLLDGMVPALSAVSGKLHAAARPVARLFIGYVPNGIIMDRWTPAAEGAVFELPPTLAPLAPFRDQLSVISGLASAPMFPLPGEGTGDHVRAAAAFLTGVHPKKTEGPDIRGGTSIDQIVAQRIGQDTQLTSLELALDPNELIGACEAGWSCAYANTLSWRNPTTPLPMENQPRAVFERLFGDTDDTSQAARLQRIREDRSILDSLVHEVDSFRSTLAPGDRDKITQYLDAIRDIERRIQLAEAQSDIELAGAGAAHRGHPGHVRRARASDVRPAGAGVPDRHDPGHHVHAVARGQPPDLSGAGHPRPAPRVVSSPEPPRADGEAGEGESGSHRAVRLFPRPAARHPSGRPKPEAQADDFQPPVNGDDGGTPRARRAPCRAGPSSISPAQDRGSADGCRRS